MYNWTTALNTHRHTNRQVWICSTIKHTSPTHSAGKSNPVVFFITSSQILAQLQQSPYNSGLMCYNYNFYSLRIYEKEGDREWEKKGEISHKDSCWSQRTRLKIPFVIFWTFQLLIFNLSGTSQLQHSARFTSMVFTMCFSMTLCPICSGAHLPRTAEAG